jgi:adenine-specific DNA-methyltransferase
MPNLNVKTLGQVFTKNHTVDLMLSLRKNNGTILEPSCGAGAFSNNIPSCIAVELDKKVAPPYALCMDFFNYRFGIMFESIIGNPPFVRYKDIMKSTLAYIEADGYEHIFDERSNLYLFFIYKCLFHLEENGGELIFINPREFLKATSSIKLNNALYQQGTITDLIDLGDAKIFGDFTPNCVIWRFEKGNFSRKTNYATVKLMDNKIVLSSKEVRDFRNTNGQLVFTKTECTVPFKDLFYVKVGAVSGADEIFGNCPQNGKNTTEFVNSETIATGKTKPFYYNVAAPELEPFKKELINRKIKKFTKDTWYMWGRNLFVSSDKRIYVNCKTRQQDPFYQHSCNNYDGSVLGLFIKNDRIDINALLADLNAVDWEELGFMCNNRFIFAQKSLENCLLPKSFEKYLV